MTSKKIKPALSADQTKILQARHHDPFSVLGLQQKNKKTSICVFAPNTQELCILPGKLKMSRLPGSDFFEWTGKSSEITPTYQLKQLTSSGYESVYYDPYCFPAQLSEFDLHLFAEGKHWHIYRILGSHCHSIDGISGVLFSTWAPSAERVSIIGDFNDWDGRRNPMRNRGSTGVWELFIPGLDAGCLYKFEIRNMDSGEILQKTDPYGQQFENR
ncbi:MAG: 1,4-alpha-glucan branching enzyme, partial [Gammaproteobacteria bacterium]|nr:1,4-alpha-glucan branching enzyme [Gammaproteobacteria bacterium]